MCNATGIAFGKKHLQRHLIEAKRVLEVGATDVNGSLRPFLEAFKPKEYIGVDIADGPGVDVVCDARYLTDRFGKEAFDVVFSTEMLEHVFDWRAVVSNFKSVLKPTGSLLLTTRSKGFPYHGYPFDFWRFEVDDMKKIFDDMEILSIESDIETAPGVFVFARKTDNFAEANLESLGLYSIITHKREVKMIDPLSTLGKIKYGFLGGVKSLSTRIRNSYEYRIGSRV